MHRTREESGVTGILVGLAMIGVLLVAAIVAPRDFHKRERHGIVTDCQRDPLRPYARPKRGRDNSG